MAFGRHGHGGRGKRAHRRADRRGVERLEDRRLLASFTVTTTADDGPGSLREAINGANASLAASTIDFNIAPAQGQPNGPQTILPLSPLPIVTVPVDIDGTTEPGFDPTLPLPMIEISGTLAGNSDGLDFQGGGSTIRGLAVDLFGGSGIVLDTGGGDLLTLDFLGTDTTGGIARGNTLAGLFIKDSPDNTIGGATIDDPVVISSNGINQDAAGLTIAGAQATGNLVLGSYIGTDITGERALGNTGGIGFAEGASGNTIGGTTSHNVISGNLAFGIGIDGSNGAISNILIQGNYIGIDAGGLAPLGNSAGGLGGGDGVAIQDASGITIGGSVDGARNIISGNGEYGISINGPATAGDLIQGNSIGIDASGTLGLGNRFGGIEVATPGNTIGGTTIEAGNVVSANGAPGQFIESFGVQLDGTAAGGNLVEGNFLGTSGTGSPGFTPLGNIGYGLVINGASGNTIGGTAAGAGNVISANSRGGVDLTAGAQGNLLQGNKIGVNAKGSPRPDILPMGNIGPGLTIEGASSGNTIGGTSAAAGNIVSDNRDDGIQVKPPGGNLASGNLIEGNLIGTDASGTANRGNFGYGVDVLGGSLNTIGGTTPGSGNLISGNQTGGIASGGQGTLVQGDLIGTDASGKVALGNRGEGVILLAAAADNTIGGTSAGARNVISGNKTEGIASGGQRSVVIGNLIGTDSTGSLALGNTDSGVAILAAAVGNTIGGLAPGSTNVISGNGTDGISIAGQGTAVLGNLIGTDSTGTVSLGNLGNGVAVLAGAVGNTIGGSTAAARNVVSGNGSQGLSIAGDGTVVAGDRIGTDASGTSALPNLNNGVSVFAGAVGNTIGGLAPGSGNLISGNATNGISDAGQGLLVAGNFIGTDATGSLALGNIGNGVILSDGPAGTIGGTSTGAGNVIAGNSGGISVNNTPGTLIQGNRIGLGILDSDRLGNIGIGVLVNNSNGTTIGGTSAGAGNVIASNGTGVFVPSGVGNAILTNRIFDNGLGIDIGPPGRTSNTPGGPHAGANDLQNYPVLIVTNTKGGVSTTSGTLNSTPNTTFTLQFFADQLYPNAFGQGRAFLGQQAVTTDGSGNAAFTFSAPTLPGQGTYISATATDPAGNTSEFSQAITELSDTVTNTSDAGPGSLRQAILDADALPGAQVIDFAIAGPGPFVIALQSPLPALTNSVVVDGNSQAGARPNTLAQGDDAVIQVTLDGTSAGQQAAGLTIDAGSCTIRGLAIVRFGGAGIVVDVGGGSVIEGNFIGDAPDGSPLPGNHGDGVDVLNSASNLIGGASPSARNLISGNAGNGIEILGQASTGNVVQGNAIGTDRSGGSRLGNSQDGLFLLDAGGNLVGGPAPGEGNVISANGSVGVQFLNNSSVASLASGNAVLGNLIGLDPSGTLALGNAGSGVLVQAASSTVIAGNVLSANGGSGADLEGGSADSVFGNTIGTDLAGGLALGNAINGLTIGNASAVTIGGSSAEARNLISGNADDGISLGGLGATGDVIAGNFLGTDRSGSAAIGNGLDGVRLDNAGPLDGVEANVISGNLGVGLEIIGVTTNAPVLGNLIGTNAAGTGSLGNEFGVFLNTSEGITIGGTTPGSRNVISGNRSLGLQIFAIAPGRGRNAVEGNYIGTTADGRVALGNGVPGAGASTNAGVGVFINNAAGVEIGGTDPGAGNLISGNLGANVSVDGQANVADVGNRIEGNTIGALLGTPPASLAPTGQDTSRYQNLGVVINNSKGNTVGGLAPGAGNLIEDNLIGVEIVGVPSTDATFQNAVEANTIASNYIGAYLNNSVRDLIAANAISSNTSLGVAIVGALSTGNVVSSNRITSNGFTGVYIEAASHNLIGGPTDAQANVISSNGVVKPGRNGVGVYFFKGAVGNTVERNRIQSNTAYGVFLYNSAGNVAGVVRGGRNANRIVGNGIAEFREYTNLSGVTTTPKHGHPTPKGPKAKAARRP